MAIDAKVSFMNQLQNRLSDVVPINTMTTILAAFSDISERFDMREMDEDEEQDDLLDCFLNAMAVQGRSEQTIDNYRRVLTMMMEAVNVKTRKITVYHLRQYITGLKERGIKDSTREGYRQVCSSYFGWLHREGLIERNPMGNIGTVKCQKKQKKIITPVEMEKLSSKCPDFRYDKRNRAIMEFLRATGCRISEMTGLDRDSVNMQTLEVVVLGKGNKERKVYLDDVAGMILKEYLDGRRDENPALFAGQNGERLKPGGVRAMLKKLAVKANVENVHPHKFRRTLATNLNRRGMPIQEVAHILGHEKLDTTMKYVVLNDDDLKNDYRRYT